MLRAEEFYSHGQRRLYDYMCRRNLRLNSAIWVQKQAITTVREGLILYHNSNPCLNGRCIRIEEPLPEPLPHSLASSLGRGPCSRSSYESRSGEGGLYDVTSQGSRARRAISEDQARGRNSIPTAQRRLYDFTCRRNLRLNSTIWVQPGHHPLARGFLAPNP
jgi:hypothetical protein